MREWQWDRVVEPSSSTNMLPAVPSVSMQSTASLCAQSSVSPLGNVSGPPPLEPQQVEYGEVHTVQRRVGRPYRSHRNDWHHIQRNGQQQMAATSNTNVHPSASAGDINDPICLD